MINFTEAVKEVLKADSPIKLLPPGIYYYHIVLPDSIDEFKKWEIIKQRTHLILTRIPNAELLYSQKPTRIWDNSFLDEIAATIFTVQITTK